MALPVALGYLLARADFFSFRKGLRFREKLLWFSQERLQKTVVVGLAAVIMGVGIVFSRSRTGISIFCATLFLMVAALSASAGGRGGRGGPRGGRRSARVLRTVALLVVFSAVLIGVRPVIERFSWANMKKEERPVFYRNTLALIGAFPVAGVGPGAFMDAYPAFDVKSNPGLVDHAHNDYLEVLAESGLIAGGTLILFSLGTWAFLFARWLGRTDNFDRGIVLGTVLGILAMLIHSLTDFNLRVPSNAAVFVALHGLALRMTLEFGRGGVREKRDDG
jgi:O-antigen ligase